MSNLITQHYRNQNKPPLYPLLAKEGIKGWFILVAAVLRYVDRGLLRANALAMTSVSCHVNHIFIIVCCTICYCEPPPSVIASVSEAILYGKTILHLYHDQ